METWCIIVQLMKGSHPHYWSSSETARALMETCETDVIQRTGWPLPPYVTFLLTLLSKVCECSPGVCCVHSVGRNLKSDKNQFGFD